MKIDLLVPAIRHETIPVSRACFFPPLGLLSLATYAKSQMRNLDIRVVDCNIGIDSNSLLRPDVNVVGLSPSILSYENCIDICKGAKKLGATVILGGPHAAGLGRKILQSQDSVDYVIQGDGELPFVHVLQGVHDKDIPGLIYRDSHGIQQNESKNYDLDRY
ncbi:MAG: hypothetical protein E3J86_10165, partial [Candidatus Thorarchaeota archaeon]